MARAVSCWWRFVVFFLGCACCLCLGLLLCPPGVTVGPNLAERGTSGSLCRQLPGSSSSTLAASRQRSTSSWSERGIGGFHQRSLGFHGGVECFLRSWSQVVGIAGLISCAGAASPDNTWLVLGSVAPSGPDGGDWEQGENLCHESLKVEAIKVQDHLAL